jgi:hypothetical protein
MFALHCPPWKLNWNELRPHNGASTLPTFSPNKDILNETEDIESLTSDEPVIDGSPSPDDLNIDASPMSEASAFVGSQAEYYERFGYPEGDKFDGIGSLADIGDGPISSQAAAASPAPAHKELVSTLPIVKHPCNEGIQETDKTYRDQGIQVFEYRHQGVQASPHPDGIQVPPARNTPRKQLKRRQRPDDAEKDNDDGRRYLQASHSPKAAKRRRQPEVVKFTVEMRLSEEGEM